MLPWIHGIRCRRRKSRKKPHASPLFLTTCTFLFSSVKQTPLKAAHPSLVRQKAVAGGPRMYRFMDGDVASPELCSAADGPWGAVGDSVMSEQSDMMLSGSQSTEIRLQKQESLRNRFTCGSQMGLGAPVAPAIAIVDLSQVSMLGVQKNIHQHTPDTRSGLLWVRRHIQLIQHRHSRPSESPVDHRSVHSVGRLEARVGALIHGL